MKTIKKKELKKLISESAYNVLNEISSDLLNRTAQKQTDALEDDFYLENHSEDYIRRAYNRIDKFKQGAREAKMKEILAKKQSAPQRNREFEKENFLKNEFYEYVKMKFSNEIYNIRELYKEFVNSEDFQNMIKQHIEYYSLNESVNKNVAKAKGSDITRMSDSEIANMKAYTQLEETLIDSLDHSYYTNKDFTYYGIWKASNNKDVKFNFLLLNLVLRKKFEEKGYVVSNPSNNDDNDFSKHKPYVFRPRKSKKYIKPKLQMNIKNQNQWSAIKDFEKMEVKFHYYSTNNKHMYRTPDLYVEFNMPEEYGTYSENFYSTYYSMFYEMIFNNEDWLGNDFKNICNILQDAIYKVNQKKTSILLKNDNEVEFGGRNWYNVKYYALFNKPCHKASGLSLSDWRDRVLDFINGYARYSIEIIYAKSLGQGYGATYPGMSNKSFGTPVGILFIDDWSGDNNRAERMFKKFLEVINIQDMKSILDSNNPSIGKVQPKENPRNSFVEITKETFK